MLLSFSHCVASREGHARADAAAAELAELLEKKHSLEHWVMLQNLCDRNMLARDVLNADVAEDLKPVDAAWFRE